jgi:hypothetical protein
VRGLAGGLDVRYRKERPAEHTSATFFLPDPDGEREPALQLDVLHQELGESRRAAVIKIDVEGMELAVLQSAWQTIARDRPILYVEISALQMARCGAAPHDVELFLRRLGYRFFRNVGYRNSTNDEFELVELVILEEVAALYDVLAIPERDGKLGRAGPLPASGAVPSASRR